MLAVRLHHLIAPLTVLMFTQRLGGATVAFVSASTIGRSCVKQTSNAAECIVFYEPKPPNEGVGGAIVRASAESLSLSGDLQIISTNRLSEAVGGEGEFRASFSGLVTITALTGATGVGYLLSELVTTVSGLDGGLDFSLTHGDEVLSDHIDSDNDQVLSTRFTFGKPFPLAAEITASLSSNFAFGIQGTLDIQNLFVLDLDSPEGVGIPSTITYVESPVPEISTSWLVVAGLGLLPIRRALRNR